MLLNENLKKVVTFALNNDWSLEQIDGRFKMKVNFRISFKPIYRTIASGILNVLAKQVLRRKGKSKEL